jgi:hypothetical protein
MGNAATTTMVVQDSSSPMRSPRSAITEECETKEAAYRVLKERVGSRLQTALVEIDMENNCITVTYPVKFMNRVNGGISATVIV